MSLKVHTNYSVVCDYPGCERNAQDGSEYASWEQDWYARDEARDSDWLVGDEGDYCPDHWYWDEDADEGRPVPATLEGEFMLADRRIRQSIATAADRAEARLMQMASDSQHRAHRDWGRAMERFGLSPYKHGTWSTPGYRPQIAV